MITERCSILGFTLLITVFYPLSTNTFPEVCRQVHDVHGALETVQVVKLFSIGRHSICVKLIRGTSVGL